MTTPRISLNQQIEAVRFAETRYRSFALGTAVKPMRGKSAEEYDLQRLGAAARTLEWLAQHEAELRAFLAHPPATRQAALSVAAQLAQREAIAKAGGPVR
jgi:hypothetical protein